MAAHDLLDVRLLDFDAGIMAHAASENPVQQFSLTGALQQSHYGATVLARRPITYGGKGQQGCQMANAYVSGARLLDFASGVGEPVLGHVESQHFSLRSLSKEPRHVRGSSVPPCCGRSSGIRRAHNVSGHVSAIPRPLSGGRITLLHPMSTDRRNTESSSASAISPSNTAHSRARGIFTVAGIVDSFIYHGHKALRKKMEIGKLG